MNNKSNFIVRDYTLIISILTLFISFSSSNQWSKFPVGNQFLWWLVEFIFIYCLFTFKGVYSNSSLEKNVRPVVIYLFWNVFCIIRGMIIADNYWEWKNLIEVSFLLFLPLIVYLANSFEVVKNIIGMWFKYGLIIFIFYVPFLFGDAVGKFLIPVSFLSLFFPILTTKWKIIVIVFAIFVIGFDITARSNVIKFVVPFLISGLYYFKFSLNKKNINILRLILLYLPFLLLATGVLGIFNVFKIDEYFGEVKTKTISESGEQYEENLSTDTRTFLYVEVIESALKNNYLLFGRTPARGNDSVSFGDYNKEKLGTGKQERFSNEVSILNIFTWLGIIGVVLYFLVFLRSSFLAINHSNNIFIKLIGLNVSFRWTYGFVEDFSNFDLSNIFLWLMIGMCFSKTFRQMSNSQMKNWVLSIFDLHKYTRSSLNPDKQLN